MTLALLGAGVLVIVVSLLGALTFRPAYERLHFLTPVTSLGGPLVGLSLAVANGLGLTTAEILLIVALLAATGPVVETATGRLAAQRAGAVPRESPE